MPLIHPSQRRRRQPTRRRVPHWVQRAAEYGQALYPLLAPLIPKLHRDAIRGCWDLHDWMKETIRPLLDEAATNRDLPPHLREAVRYFQGPDYLDDEAGMRRPGTRMCLGLRQCFMIQMALDAQPSWLAWLVHSHIRGFIRNDRGILDWLPYSHRNKQTRWLPAPRWPLHHRWRNGKTLLHVTAAAADDLAVKELLRRGVSPSVRDSQGHTPLESCDEVWQPFRPNDRMVEHEVVISLLTQADTKNMDE